ncbi:adenylate cyclase type 2 isoform X2 [Folsomia candida]|uniref:adenylate cyclase type 2 isoform X2 n=1 Tax=Folsomia candida TaxID=158441 RepID=UPI001604E2D9|nr:adenylate cyclase type 2 isoform X2 [Folsomia candida]
MERLSVDNLSLGMGILARKSLTTSGSRKASQISLLNDSFAEHYHQIDDRNWSWTHLRESFRRDKLGALYDHYQRRLQNSYFNVFLLVQAVLSLAYFGFLIYVSLVYATRDIEFEGCNSTITSISCTAKDNLELAVPEMVVHVIISVLCIAIFMAVFNETLFRSNPHLQIVISIIICLVMLVGDLGLSVYYFQNYRLIRTTFAFQTIIIIYFFLPVPQKRQAILLGAVSSTAHLIISAVFYTSDDRDHEVFPLVFAEAIYYFCGNAVGVYSRLLSEIAIRRAFMDRRGYIKSTIKKTYEKDQEDQLLLSILPEHISSKVQQELRNAIQQIAESQSQSSHHRNSTGSSHNQHIHHKKPFSDLFVERHDNVTIIFSDIVNFTPLTVKMPADELVETLNELFGRFDEAATRNGCVRIKLLGDCYYCVSGLNEPTPDHAKNCVNLGFEMIEIIHQVGMQYRNKLKVDLAMRIGVHSGNIMSGLLGIYKWQFDIWSRDVTIAQHMEQSGKPGRVHITKQTKAFLGDDLPYICKPAYGKMRDKYLSDNDIETYLISPPRKLENNSDADPDDFEEDEVENVVEELTSPNSTKTKFKVKGLGPSARRGSQALGKSVDLIRRKSIRANQDRRNNLSGNDVMRYLTMLDKVNQQMEKAIDEMPLRKSEQWCPGESRHKNSITNQVNPYTMSFNEMDSEIHFQSQPDPLFKFYIACSLFVLLCIGIVQSVTVPPEHLSLWLSFGGGLSCLMILIPFVWVGYIWSRIKDPHRELDYVPEPENKLIRFFFNTSTRVSSSWIWRTILYLSISLLISAFAIIDVLECTAEKCESPWYFTFSCSLAVLIIFAFFRIHYFLKLLVSVLSMTGYFTIFSIRHEVFAQNNGMEYINRLDFVWKRKLTEEHKEASMTHAVNTILIHNILPTQIAKIYLDPNRAGEGYSRTYNNVSIMFASIPDFMDFYSENDLNKHGLVCLNVLNQIITEFDQALFNHVDVEKIKVIGSCYMCACGLEVHDTGRLSTTSFVGGDDEECVPTWRDYGRHTNGIENIEKRKKTLYTLVNFASDMMVKLQMINREAFQDFQLRVGVATGLVVAGVVGVQKPLFDIWSDTCNLASRLDSHGQTGKVHVTEYGADLLAQSGIKCEFRGVTNIKGKGNMRTYFVCMDEHYKIQYIDNPDVTTSAALDYRNKVDCTHL